MINIMARRYGTEHWYSYGDCTHVTAARRHAEMLWRLAPTSTPEELEVETRRADNAELVWNHICRAQRSTTVIPIRGDAGADIR